MELTRAVPRIARVDLVAGAVRRLGLVDALLDVLARALNRVSGGRVRLIKYYLLAQPVPAQAPMPLARASRIEIVPVTRDDPVTAECPRPETVIARRFAEGAVCLTARAADRFAGFLWLSLGAYEEDEVRCRYVMTPENSAAWDFDVYVHPDFRMGRTFVQLWNAANALLRERGVAWSYSRVSAFNAQSLRAHERFGARRVASAVFLCIGRMQLTVASIRPLVHFAASPRSRPVFRLRAPDGCA
jgi:hypothetical protein